LAGGPLVAGGGGGTLQHRWRLVHASVSLHVLVIRVAIFWTQYLHVCLVLGTFMHAGVDDTTEVNLARATPVQRAARSYSQ
jgi:hypothetical protein